VKAENVGSVGDGSGRVHGDEPGERHARHTERREPVSRCNRRFRTLGLRHRRLLRLVQVGELRKLRDREPLAGEVEGNLELAEDGCIRSRQISSSEALWFGGRVRDGNEREERESDALKRQREGQSVYAREATQHEPSLAAAELKV
jgi:hypothetical protein